MSGHQRPAGERPRQYQREVYLQGVKGIRPRFSFDNSSWVHTARSLLSSTAFAFAHSAAGARQTEDENTAAFRRWGLVPKRLSGVRDPELDTTVLGGIKLQVPVCAGPVGVLSLFHPEKEAAVARACTEVGVPYIMSSAAASSIEEAAEASGDGVRWFQLYWPSRANDKYTISLLHRARKAGFSALFVTLDTYILGWRPEDLQGGYNPFMQVPEPTGVQVGFNDPVFREHWKHKTGQEVEQDKEGAAREWAGIIFPNADHVWEDIAFLQEHWDGPLVLKGIMSVEDAKKAVEVGVQGIVVSNHAGRQYDGGVATLDVLPEIVAAVGDKLDIFFDSGIRTGADIVKALALGAKAVLVGRQWVYGLAMGGEAGVEHVLRCLTGELDLQLLLMGIQSVRQEHLNTSCLRRLDAPRPPVYSH